MRLANIFSPKRFSHSVLRSRRGEDREVCSGANRACDSSINCLRSRLLPSGRLRRRFRPSTSLRPRTTTARSMPPSRLGVRCTTGRCAHGAMARIISLRRATLSGLLRLAPRVPRVHLPQGRHWQAGLLSPGLLALGPALGQWQGQLHDGSLAAWCAA